MRAFRIVLAVSLAALLGACGGGSGSGGGGVVSAPPPPPPPTPSPSPTPTPAPTPSPTPTPSPADSEIANLQESRTFSDEATTTSVSVSPLDVVVETTSRSRAPITVTYDASSQSYTVQTEGRSQTFGPNEEQPQRWDGERRYAHAGSSYLTLVTNPYSSAEFSNKYVGMGYWQSNSFSGGSQQTSFSTFTYGFDTPNSSVPRTGAAHWLTDVFGLLTIPGSEVRIVQGLGDFAVDFADGTFVSSAFLNEWDVVTIGGSGGALHFKAGGQLDSANGFNGLFSYEGSDATLHGTLSGSFYGPNANEIGATFSAGGGNGASLTGALTGQRFPVGSTSDGIRNISLTNLLVDDRLFGESVALQWTTTEGENGFSSLVHGRSVGTVDVTGAGSIQSIGLDSVKYQPQAAEIDPEGPANFTTYRSILAGNPLEVSFYKVGEANSEIALTYSSFVGWQSSEEGVIPSGLATETFHRRYLVYGIETQPELLAKRTGTANFTGLAYGTGSSMRGESYQIGGTSQFTVDFTEGSYDGSLQLRGTDTNGAINDFGQWTFASTLVSGEMLSASLTGSGSYDPGSSIFPQFYGPTGQEIGAVFSLRTGQTPTEDSISIVGVTLAKQR